MIMEPVIWVLGFGLWVFGFGLWVLRLGFRMGIWLKLGLELRVWVWGSGLRV
jgi:hypothetical protein